MKLKNPISVSHPNIALQWHPTLNTITPDQISIGSHIKIYWCCPVSKDHVWISPIYVRKRSGCPYCAGRSVTLSNSLAATHPGIAAEWNFDRNSLGPHRVTSGCNRKFWWICNLGHQWESTVGNRTFLGRNCPICYENSRWGETNPSWKGCGELTGIHWKEIQRGAKRRGCYGKSINKDLRFIITKEYVWQLFLDQNRKCKLTGIELQMGNSVIERTASLDRIDSSIGYVESNVQWIHKTINMMKGSMSDQEFIEWTSKVSVFQKSK